MLPNHHTVRPLGRTHELPNALWLCYSGTDVVVINLGTNDNSYTRPSPMRRLQTGLQITFAS